MLRNRILFISTACILTGSAFCRCCCSGEKKIRARVVLSPRGMLRESAIKLKSTKKKLFIALLNRLRIPEQIHFHATDEQEKKDILQYFPQAGKVELIPNFSAGLPEQLTPIEKTPGKLRCVFISRIMPIKNILFFLKLLNMVPDDIAAGVYHLWGSGR